MNEEDKLARLDQLPVNVLRPEFRDGMQRLTALILRKVCLEYALGWGAGVGVGVGE